MPNDSQLNRRSFQRGCMAAAAGTLAASNAWVSAAVQQKFQFNYMLASCMYGYQYLGEILPEVSRVGAAAIDIWPKVHGNQREQLADLGEEKFAEMLAKYKVELGCITQYKLGPFGLQEEMRLAKRLGCKTMVTGGVGPKDAKGAELKKAVGDFIEKMKPHLEVAAETGVTIAIENHANNLINTPDSLKWLIELRPSKNLAVALAPYHLEQNPGKLGELIESLGDGIEMFYAWQHGKGCMQKLPKKQELLQMPGRGDMDFAPIVAALKKIQYSRWTEIFMHPVPRGVPILETAALVTEEINRARSYMDKLAVS